MTTTTYGSGLEVAADPLGLVELGQTGERVSAIALGCMLMGTDTDEATSVRMLDDFLGRGGTFLDTADCYAWWAKPGSHGGESEALLGRWFAADPTRRERVFLATKGSASMRADRWDSVRRPDGTADWDTARDSFAGAGADTLRRALDGSLQRLGVDHVDLYYVHVDDRSTPLEETLEGLAGLVESGKTRYLGWSNVRTWRLERIRQLCLQHGWPVPVALQQQHTYLPRRGGIRNASIVDDEQLDYLEEHPDLALVAYSPILKGLLDDPTKASAQWMWEWFDTPDNARRLEVLHAVATEAGATATQAGLAYLVQQSRPRVIPILGPRTWEQYVSVLPGATLQLSPEQLERLAAA